MTLYVENNAGESYIMYVGDAIDSSNTYIIWKAIRWCIPSAPIRSTASTYTPFSLTDKLMSLISIDNVTA